MKTPATISPLPENLSRPGIGGAAANINLSVANVDRHYWYSVGDAAQAIKRIEQDLHDNPPDDWHAFRELHLAATDFGYLNIADSPETAIELHNRYQHSPWLTLCLNRHTTRRMLSSWLTADLGNYGTVDI